MRIAAKESWKTVPMPAQRGSFRLDMQLNEAEYLQLRAGSIPEEMEDKWFFYHEEDRVFFHRSWTGYCIYIAEVQPQLGGGCLLGVVSANLDPTQYRGSLAEAEAMLRSLLAFRLKKNVDVEKLKAYFKNRERVG